VTSINVPEEVERALDERAQIGALGDMQAYMQFKAARALGDAAQGGGGEEGSLAGLGVGLGAGMGLGTVMASAIGQSMQSSMGMGPSAGAMSPVGSGGIEQGFANLRNLVAQQLTLSPDEREGARAALDKLFGQLVSSTSTMEDVRVARQELTERFPWLAEPVKTLLNTPAALQMLGQIVARSM
jgi:hypothetical protein